MHCSMLINFNPKYQIYLIHAYISLLILVLGSCGLDEYIACVIAGSLKVASSPCAPE
jgi:hypothetical protein